VFWKKDEIIVVSLGDGYCYGYERGRKDNRENEKDNLDKVLLNEVHSLDNEG